MEIVNSYFVSRSTGEKITIRTVRQSHPRVDLYVVFRGGWRVAEYRTTRGVREFIVRNDLQPVAE